MAPAPTPCHDLLNLDADLLDLSGRWLGERVPKRGDQLPVGIAALVHLCDYFRLPEGYGVALVDLEIRQHEPALEPSLLPIFGATEPR